MTACARQYATNGVTLVTESWSTPATTAPCTRYVAAATGPSKRAGSRAPVAPRGHGQHRDDDHGDPVHRRQTVAPLDDARGERGALRRGDPEDGQVDRVSDRHERQKDHRPAPVRLRDLRGKGLALVSLDGGTQPLARAHHFASFMTAPVKRYGVAVAGP